MNKWERELAALELRGEREVLVKMRGHYEAALERVNAKIEALSERDDLPGIRQRRYQESIAEQIGSAMDELRSGAHGTLEAYLRDSYERGFVGSLYNLQKQGIPLAFPIDEASMARAVRTTAEGVKLSERVYSNVGRLQKQVVAEITRGFADAESATAVARRIAEKTEIAEGIKRNVAGRVSQAFRRSMTIARTEKGRVASQSALDAMRKAKGQGADVVKQWDSTLDGRTRPDHARADGQIRELDEPFSVGGSKGLAPRMMGSAAQDVNCRCACLQRSRAALEMPEEAEYTKWDGVNQCFVDLSDAESYADFERRHASLVAGLSVEIDEMTPCLRRLSDGEIVQTSFERVSPKRGEYAGWEFDWSKPEREGNDVFALLADGDDRVQGLLAMRDWPESQAVYVSLVESAPFNNAHNPAIAGKEYSGVGAHLFAEAVKKSYELGYNGFIVFDAKSTLFEHYRKELGAVRMGGSQRMYVDETGAKILYERYYGQKP